MARLDFKRTGCFSSGRKFGHFFGETEILTKLLFLAEALRNPNRMFGLTLIKKSIFAMNEGQMRTNFSSNSIFIFGLKFEILANSYFCISTVS